MAQLGRLDLVPILYGEVLVPPAVVQELSVAVRGAPDVVIAGLSGYRIVPPGDALRVRDLRRTLDAGESEAIALALEASVPAILIDEQRGRTAASRLGLVPIGSLAILVEAKRAGHVSLIAPLIERVRREIAFRASPRIIEQALRAAGEA